MKKWIIELEPGNYLLAFTRNSTVTFGSLVTEKPDATRFDNVFRAGDARDLMKKQHGFDGARIVEVES